jgi:hypothetical protein
MTKHYCDRCKTEAKSKDNLINVRVEDAAAKYLLVGSWEICEPCVRKLYGFMEKKTE